MDARFWVVGGKFDSIDFDAMIPGTGRVFGPFLTTAQAETAWRRVSDEHRHECYTRFAVVEEPAPRSAAMLYRAAASLSHLPVA